MLDMIKQARAAVSLLNPDEVRARAARPVSVGLVAPDAAGYGELEDFLLPAGMPAPARRETMKRIHRAGDPDVPETVDLVLYHHGILHSDDAFTFHHDHPEATLSHILDQHEELALPLARQFPVFRKPVVEGLIQAVARENALFAIATALPNIVPNLIELPWAFGEFASDTAFLTANQIRMAFVIAAACGKQPGFGRQKAEILSIVAGAFGWRALARELVGHIPLGGGLIPKGAIAWAGTFAVGKSLEYYYHANRHYTDRERADVYRQALERGKDVAGSLQGN
jgi:hypothetical protein